MFTFFIEQTPIRRGESLEQEKFWSEQEQICTQCILYAMFLQLNAVTHTNYYSTVVECIWQENGLRLQQNAKMLSRIKRDNILTLRTYLRIVKNYAFDFLMNNSISLNLIFDNLNNTIRYLSVLIPWVLFWCFFNGKKKEKRHAIESKVLQHNFFWTSSNVIFLSVWILL